MSKTIWVKFLHPNDIYFIDPLFGIGLDNCDISPRTCLKCGNTLHIPVSANKIEINQPMGAIHKPFPIEQPNFIIREYPEYPTLAYYFDTKINEFTQQKLKHNNMGNLTYVSEDNLELIIEDFSTGPIKCTNCFPVEYEDLCQKL